MTTSSTITDTVTNVGGEHLDVMWGQQVAFGGALIGPDTVVQAGSTTVRSDPRIGSSSYDDLLPWPRAYGQQGLVNLRGVGREGSPESRLAYLSDFTDASIRVRRPSQDLGLELSWEEFVWPHVWYALETGRQQRVPLVRRRALPGLHALHQLARPWSARRPSDLLDVVADPPREHPVSAPDGPGERRVEP